MTRDDFIAIINRGGCGSFMLRGVKWAWASFLPTPFVGIGDEENGIQCESAEEVLEKFSIDGVPFADLLPEINDMHAIQFV